MVKDKSVSLYNDINCLHSDMYIMKTCVALSGLPAITGVYREVLHLMIRMVILPSVNPLYERTVIFYGRGTNSCICLSCMVVSVSSSTAGLCIKTGGTTNYLQQNIFGAALYRIRFFSTTFISGYQARHSTP